MSGYLLLALELGAILVVSMALAFWVGWAISKRRARRQIAAAAAEAPEVVSRQPAEWQQPAPLPGPVPEPSALSVPGSMPGIDEKNPAGAEQFFAPVSVEPRPQAEPQASLEGQAEPQAPLEGQEVPDAMRETRQNPVVASEQLADQTISDIPGEPDDGQEDTNIIPRIAAENTAPVDAETDAVSLPESPELEAVALVTPDAQPDEAANPQLEEAENRIREAEARASEAEARTLEAETRASEAEARISEADERIAEADERAQKAERQAQEHITEAEQEMEKARERIACLQEQVAKQELDMARLETRATTAWDTTMPHLISRIESLEGEMSKARYEAAELQALLAIERESHAKSFTMEEPLNSEEVHEDFQAPAPAGDEYDEDQTTVFQRIVADQPFPAFDEPASDEAPEPEEDEKADLEEAQVDDPSELADASMTPDDEDTGDVVEDDAELPAAEAEEADGEKGELESIRDTPQDGALEEVEAVETGDEDAESIEDAADDDPVIEVFSTPGISDVPDSDEISDGTEPSDELDNIKETEAEAAADEEAGEPEDDAAQASKVDDADEPDPALVMPEPEATEGTKETDTDKSFDEQDAQLDVEESPEGQATDEHLVAQQPTHDGDALQDNPLDDQLLLSAPTDTESPKPEDSGKVEDLLGDDPLAAPLTTVGETVGAEDLRPAEALKSMADSQVDETDEDDERDLPVDHLELIDSAESAESDEVVESTSSEASNPSESQKPAEHPEVPEAEFQDDPSGQPALLVETSESIAPQNLPEEEPPTPLVEDQEDEQQADQGAEEQESAAHQPETEKIAPEPKTPGMPDHGEAPQPEAESWQALTFPAVEENQEASEPLSQEFVGEEEFEPTTPRVIWPDPTPADRWQQALAEAQPKWDSPKPDKPESSEWRSQPPTPAGKAVAAEAEKTRTPQAGPAWPSPASPPFPSPARAQQPASSPTPADWQAFGTTAQVADFTESIPVIPSDGPLSVMEEEYGIIQGAFGRERDPRLPGEEPSPRPARQVDYLNDDTRLDDQ